MSLTSELKFTGRRARSNAPPARVPADFSTRRLKDEHEKIVLTLRVLGKKPSRMEVFFSLLDAKRLCQQLTMQIACAKRAEEMTPAPDICIAGAPAVNGRCDDRECVCQPAAVRIDPRQVFARNDFHVARREGEVLITGTRFGTLRLFRAAENIYQLNMQDPEACLALGLERDIISTLAPLYVIEAPK